MLTDDTGCPGVEPSRLSSADNETVARADLFLAAAGPCCGRDGPAHACREASLEAPPGAPRCIFSAGDPGHGKINRDWDISAGGIVQARGISVWILVSVVSPTDPKGRRIGLPSMRPYLRSPINRVKCPSPLCSSILE